MADRYHISDDGTPGRCKARSVASCPKTKAGDSFHGTELEAAAESERRFEDLYGSTVTLSAEEQKKLWNAKSHAVFIAVRDYARAASFADRDFEDTHAHMEDMRIRGLAKIHSVDPSQVRASYAGDYIVEDGSTGGRHVYGFIWGKDGDTLGYRGELHPKLSSTVYHSDESKIMLEGAGREATYDESRFRHDAVSYHYATFQLADGSERTITTDAKRVPVDEKVWEFIQEEPPREVFEDESLRAAITNGGVIKE